MNGFMTSLPFIYVRTCIPAHFCTHLVTQESEQQRIRTALTGAAEAPRPERRLAPAPGPDGRTPVNFLSGPPLVFPPSLCGVIRVMRGRGLGGCRRRSQLVTFTHNSVTLHITSPTESPIDRSIGGKLSLRENRSSEYLAPE
jgi:hypothetical protein